MEHSLYLNSFVRINRRSNFRTQ